MIVASLLNLFSLGRGWKGLEVLVVISILSYLNGIQAIVVKLCDSCDLTKKKPSLNRVRIFSAKSEGRNTIKVRILGKVLQVNEMVVPDQKRALQMSIFLSAGHNMTTYLKTEMCQLFLLEC